ncbi:c-type cytochrome [bacterium]|nr:c-type cytochrome [bacterium]
MSRWVFLSLLLLAWGRSATGGEPLSPQALAADHAGRRLYIAETTARRVAVFDLEAWRVVKRIALEGVPGGLALSADDSRLYVADAAPLGCVWVVDPRRGRVLSTLPAGHTPGAMVQSRDGATLFVCNRFNHDLSVIDLASGREVKRIAVSREPVAAVRAPPSDLLFVANLLPAGPANGASSAAVVSVIDARAAEAIGEIALPNGSTSVLGIAASPDGAYIYATHTLARYQLPTTQLERGWMNTSAVSVIRVADRALVNTVLLDEPDLGAANPWGVACSADGRRLYVAHAGTHELSVIDRTRLHEKLDRLAAGAVLYNAPPEEGGGPLTAADVPDDLAFLAGLRTRVPLPGVGPREVVAVGDRLFAAQYFSDSLAVVDLGGADGGRTSSIPLGPEPTLSPARRGEMLFHDARQCFQHWQSCASCHPGEARVDALNWDLGNDGLGNPKNTKSLLMAHQTPPAMSRGVRERAETAVRAGLLHIQFAVPEERDASAMDTYLRSLAPVPSPYRIDGRLSPAATRGQALFAEAGCARCHPGPLYTDLAAYDVGTGAGIDQGKPLDTPTLVEVWRTAPYLHDGRAATIKEVLTTFNGSDKHGSTSKLTEQEVDDLAEFVLSL